MEIFKNGKFVLTLLCLSAQCAVQPALWGNSDRETYYNDFATQTSHRVTKQSAAPQDLLTDFKTDNSPTNVCLMQGTPLPTAADGDRKEGATKQTLQTFASFAVMPLDWLKKTTLFVLRSPVLVLAATSALLPDVNAFVSNHMGHKILRQHKRKISLGLTPEWNTEMCVGRALDATDIKTFKQNQKACRMRTCAPWVRQSTSCNDLRRPGQLRHDGVLGFNYLCDNIDCWPNFVKIGYAGAVRKEIEICKKKACEQLGHPYTGQFVCKASRKHRNNSRKRIQINNVLLDAEKCLDRFCQEKSLRTCPKKLFWWQAPFSSACNESLCPEHFLPKDTQTNNSGTEKSLETLGKETKAACQNTRSFKTHCR